MLVRLTLCLALIACGRSGRIGEPCVADGDCIEALCAPVGADGAICTQVCADSCAVGFECVTTDAGRLCVPEGVANCQPCEVDGDCNQGGLGGYRCVPYGAAGSFCGAACDGPRRPGELSSDAACAAGYGCVDGVCRRDACACNAIGIALGAETTCEIVNAFGRCSGMRGCGASGLSACVGPAPAAEQCDGLDNDCDGATDEGTCTHAAR